MYVLNLDELIGTLKTKLPEYLAYHDICKLGQKKFKCFNHQENTPSMVLMPGEEAAYCFGCQAHFDIFSAANKIENLPTIGAQWISETLPHLAKTLDIPIQTGAVSEKDAQRYKLLKIYSDINNILCELDKNGEYKWLSEYFVERGWSNPDIVGFTIPKEKVIGKLSAAGWSNADLAEANVLKDDVFGTNKCTFVLKDYLGRPVGFSVRIIKGDIKYINSSESPIYEKRKTLLGLDSAIREAKKKGLIIVEGNGDLCQLRRLGYENTAATCGTSLTQDHLMQLKQLGIRNITLCFDWDTPGQNATEKFLLSVIKTVPGISPYVIIGPDGHKDPDEFLKDQDTSDAFDNLTIVSAFKFMIHRLAERQEPEELCLTLVPIIAAEAAAIKREKLIEELSQATGISFQAIFTDVLSIRDSKANERRERLKAAAEQHLKDLSSDPDNVSALIGTYEGACRRIEKDYEKDIIGPNYQLSRYEAIQELKILNEDGTSSTVFKMDYFPEFSSVFGEGAGWTTGCVIYMGGRANSGKSATAIAIGVDVALSDPDAIVIIHFTDDTYIQSEPRIKTNISTTLNPEIPFGDTLNVGEAGQPHVRIKELIRWDLYNQADSTFRKLLAEERLIIIDAEDGATLTSLERQLRYVRKNHPTKKLLVIQDNCYNLQDFSNMDQMRKMTCIGDRHKELVSKYKCCLIATVEYKKNMQFSEHNPYPKNDDIADARAMTYRPNAIVHVYNELHDMGEEKAEIFWVSDKEPQIKRPRLILVFGKNKISGFKGKLVIDLDSSPEGSTVSIRPVNINDAKRSFENLNKGQTAQLEIEAEEFLGEDIYE